MITHSHQVFDVLCAVSCRGSCAQVTSEETLETIQQAFSFFGT